MTDKQIKIDDCIHLDEWKHCDICEKLIKTKDGANAKKREHLLIEEDLRCDFYPNCYYKQLKRAEQKLAKIEELLEPIKCKHPEDCWENKPDWNGEVYGCEPDDMDNIASCPSKVATSVLQIIEGKENE